MRLGCLLLGATLMKGPQKKTFQAGRVWPTSWMAGRVFLRSQWPALEARLSGFWCQVVCASLDCYSVGRFQIKPFEKPTETILSLSELKLFLLIFLALMRAAEAGGSVGRVALPSHSGKFSDGGCLYSPHGDASVLPGVLAFRFLMPQRSLSTTMPHFGSCWLPKDRGRSFRPPYCLDPEMIHCHCRPIDQPRTVLFLLQRRDM